MLIIFGNKKLAVFNYPFLMIIFFILSLGFKKSQNYKKILNKQTRTWYYESVAMNRPNNTFHVFLDLYSNKNHYTQLWL